LTWPFPDCRRTHFYEAVGDALAAFKGALDVVDLDDGFGLCRAARQEGGLARVG
jgi:hypothetical protein